MSAVDIRDRWGWLERGPNTPERLEAWKEMIRAGYDPVSGGPFHHTDPAKREAYIVLWSEDNADPTEYAALFETGGSDVC